MVESSRFMSVERFISANVAGTKGQDREFIQEIVDESVNLGNEGELKLTNFSIITPFVALGGNVENFVSYFKTKHNIDPQNWGDWNEILKELQGVFNNHFS
jgi:hypothetical protein